jgi:hypothetical protein
LAFGTQKSKYNSFKNVFDDKIIPARITSKSSDKMSHEKKESTLSCQSQKIMDAYQMIQGIHHTNSSNQSESEQDEDSNPDVSRLQIVKLMSKNRHSVAQKRLNGDRFDKVQLAKLQMEKEKETQKPNSFRKRGSIRYGSGLVQNPIDFYQQRKRLQSHDVSELLKKFESTSESKKSLHSKAKRDGQAPTIYETSESPDISSDNCLST